MGDGHTLLKGPFKIRKFKIKNRIASCHLPMIMSYQVTNRNVIPIKIMLVLHVNI